MKLASTPQLHEPNDALPIEPGRWLIAPRLRGRAPPSAVRRSSRWAIVAALLAIMALGAYALLPKRTSGTSTSIVERFFPARGTGAKLSSSTAVLPSPQDLRPIAPEEAIVINAKMPLAAVPNPSATAFQIKNVAAGTQAQAVECLTAAVYYEAATEPLDGQRAVAQVVLNRVRHPAYPNSVCGVVFQGSERRTGCQFTFTCDGSLARKPSSRLWSLAQQVAREALAGYVHKPVGLATNYHADYVVPYWASSLHKIAVVGRHIFYRWKGGWGEPRSFSDAYAGVEPGLLAPAIAASTQITTAILPSLPNMGPSELTPTSTAKVSNILVPDPVLHIDTASTNSEVAAAEARAPTQPASRLAASTGALKADLNRPQLRAELATKAAGDRPARRSAPSPSSAVGDGGSRCSTRVDGSTGPIGSAVVRAQPMGTGSSSLC